jgi:hypothetical protein
LGSRLRLSILYASKTPQTLCSAWLLSPSLDPVSYLLAGLFLSLLVFGLGNDGPINSVVSTSLTVRRRLRSLPIARFANRRVEHGPFPHTEFGFPENRARGRCNGVEAFLSALVHPGWLDHGWGALALQTESPGALHVPRGPDQECGLPWSPPFTEANYSRAPTPPHGR